MRLFRLLPLAALVLLLPSPAVAAGGWGWPLPPPHRVVHGFDPPDQPWLPGHRGVDLAGRAGEPVRAAGDGVVAFAGRVGGVPVVSIRHPEGLLTTYEPVRASLRAGTAVRRGGQIGRLVATGSHCAPAVCLHWGLRRGLTYLDPLSLLGAGQVRLLPMEGGGVVGPAGWGVPVAGGAVIAAGSLLLRRRRLAPPPPPR